MTATTRSRSPAKRAAPEVKALAPRSAGGSRNRYRGGHKAAALVVGLLLSPLGSALTVDEAVRLGLQSHPAVAVAEAELAAASTEVDIARDGYWPTVQMSAGPENSLRHEIGYELTARQVLYDWGRVRARIDRASAVERQHVQALRAASEDAALEITEAYLDVLLYEARLSAAERHFERISGLAVLSRDRSMSGYADRGESDRAELELARAAEQQAVERSALLDAEARLRDLLARPASGLAWPEPPPLPAWLARGTGLAGRVEDAPLFQQAKARADAAHAEQLESRAALKPELNLEGSLLRRELGGQMEEDAVIALRLRMAPLQGLGGFRQVEAAARREDAARWAMREVSRGIRRDVGSWVEQERMLAQRLESLGAQLENAEALVDVYREQFDAGLRDIEDLLPVHRELLETERQLSDRRSEKIRLHYRIAARLGRLGEVLQAQSRGHQGGAVR